MLISLLLSDIEGENEMRAIESEYVPMTFVFGKFERDLPAIKLVSLENFIPLSQSLQLLMGKVIDMLYLLCCWLFGNCIANSLALAIQPQIEGKHTCMYNIVIIATIDGYQCEKISES